MLTMTAQAADDMKYPDWKGEWITINYRLGGQVIKYDPDRPWGVGQQAPLTAEAQKILEESMADQSAGGIGNYPTAKCLPGGMPRMLPGIHHCGTPPPRRDRNSRFQISGVMGPGVPD